MELGELSLTELREKAKNEGIKNTSKFKKEELIAILMEKCGQEEPETQEKSERWSKEPHRQ